MTEKGNAGSLNKYIYVLLSAAVGVIPLQQELAAFLAAAAGIATLALRLTGQRERVSVLSKWQQGLCWTLLAIGGASVYFSADRFLSAYNYAYVVGQYSLLICALLYVGGAEGVRRVGGDFKSLPFYLQLLAILLTVSFFVSAVGILQKFLGVAAESVWVDQQQFPELKVRVYSTLVNPNILAGYLVLVTAYATVFLCACSERGKLWLALLTADLLAFVCLLYTYSRGNWLACAVMLPAFALFFKRKALLPVILAGAGGLALGGQQVVQRLASVVSGADTSAALRMAYIHSTKAIIEDFPWGVGWYGYRFVYPDYNYYLSDTGVIMYHCHNLFLNLTAELGYHGLAIFLLLWGSFLYRGLQLARQGKSAWLRAAGQAYLTASLGIAVGGMTDHVYFNTQMGLLFWTLGIITMLAWREQQKAVGRADADGKTAED